MPQPFIVNVFVQIKYCLFVYCILCLFQVLLNSMSYWVLLNLGLSRDTFLNDHCDAEGVFVEVRITKFFIRIKYFAVPVCVIDYICLHHFTSCRVKMTENTSKETNH